MINQESASAAHRRNLGDCSLEQGKYLGIVAQFAERQGKEKPPREGSLKPMSISRGSNFATIVFGPIGGSAQTNRRAANGATSITRNIARAAWIFRNTRCAEKVSPLRE